MLIFADDEHDKLKEITFEESFEIYLMRANYEIMAVRLLGGKIPEETLQEMEEILERIEESECG